MRCHKISEKKLFTILSIDLFSMTGLLFPAVIVRAGGKQGLPALLVASGLAALFACYFLWLTKEGTFSCSEVVGSQSKGGQYAVLAIYGVRYFLHGLFLMVVFADLMGKMLLPGQNRGLLLLPFFLLTYPSVKKDLSTRGSILEVLFPFIFLPLLLVLFLALFQVDYGSLPEQLWQGGIWKGNLRAVYQIFLFYQPMEFLLFLLPCREKRNKGFGVLLACIFVVSVNLLFYVTAVGIFGAKGTGANLWSALSIMQSVKLPGYFIQRLDILFLVFYIFSTFSLFSGYLFYSQMLVEGKREEKHKKIYRILYLLLLFAAAIEIRDMEKFYEFFLGYKMWLDLPLALLVPLLVRWRWEYKKGAAHTKKKGIEYEK